MPRSRPACEIEPLFSIASSSRIFPGPKARPLLKSALNVSDAIIIDLHAETGNRCDPARTERNLRQPCDRLEREVHLPKQSKRGSHHQWRLASARPPIGSRLISSSRPNAANKLISP